MMSLKDWATTAVAVAAIVIGGVNAQELQYELLNSQYVALVAQGKNALPSHTSLGC